MKELKMVDVTLAIKTGKSDNELCKEFDISLEALHNFLDNHLTDPVLKDTKKKLRDNRKKKKPRKPANPTPQETLEEKEARLSKVCIEEEERIKTLRAEKSMVRKGIQTDVQLLTELYSKWVETGDHIKELESRDKELCNEINSLVSSHATNQDELELVRLEIEDAKKPVVTFFNDGHFTCSRPDEQLSTEGWEQIRVEIMDQRECLYLTNLQTKNLAQIVAIQRNSTKEIEWQFEDPTMEQMLKFVK